MLLKLPQLFTASFWTSFFRRGNALIAKFGRICVAATRGFNDDECPLKASALTFSSLLSIVPVLAVAFGIAKGFGFEKHLENEITQKFFEQREVADKLIAFAYSALSNAQGGLIAGIGIIALFWTVLKLLGNIESSFNSIWKVHRSRSIARKFSDYLAMMIFCPLFFAASSSLSIFIVTQVTSYSRATGIWDTVSPIISLSFQVFPLLFSWALFTAIYLIMPNTKVPFSFACAAGIVAGTAFQIVQWAYINFQLGISSYGAIYGSFAALPLFLLWLYISWVIALAGAEIAYHAENDISRVRPEGSDKMRPVDERLVGLSLTGCCIQSFKQGTPPPTLHKLAQQMGLSVIATRRVANRLKEAGILSEVKSPDNNDECYQPGRDIRNINIKAVCDALDSSRHQYYIAFYDGQMQLLDDRLAAFDQQNMTAPDNVILEDITRKIQDMRNG